MVRKVRSQDSVRLAREFAAVVSDVVRAGDSEAGNRELLEWSSALLRRPPAPALLAKLSRYGADLEKLLLIGLRFRTNRVDYERALVRFSFGPTCLREAVTVPINHLLRCIDADDNSEEVETALPDMPPMEILREYDRRLQWRNEQIRADGARPRRVWKPGPDGEPLETEFTPDLDGASAIFLRGNLLDEPEPAPHQREGPGHPTDVAEAVLVVLVAGHLKAVCNNPHLNLAGQFVSRVLQIPSPQCGKFSDQVRAFENRARRHWAKPGMKSRAKLLAEEFNLPIRFD